MTSASETLEDYLSEPNPILTGAGSIENGNQKSSSRQSDEKWPILHTIKPWEDFTLPTLKQLSDRRLSAVLGEHIAGLHDFSYIDKTSVRIYDERALEALIGKSIQQTVNEALDKSSEVLVHQQVRMVTGGQAVLPMDSKKQRRPDWAGVVIGADINSLPNNILLGDTKPSWVWQSETDIHWKPGTKTLKLPSLSREHSLRQVVHYCCLANARYAYLITNLELLVIRVSDSKHGEGAEPSADDLKLDPQTRKRKLCSESLSRHALVECASTPWTTPEGSSNNLKINLALWTLHILAANDGELTFGPYGKLSEEKLLDVRSRTAAPSGDDSSDETETAASVSTRQDTVVDGVETKSDDEDNPEFSFYCEQPVEERSFEEPSPKKRRLSNYSPRVTRSKARSQSSSRA